MTTTVWAVDVPHDTDQARSLAAANNPDGGVIVISTPGDAAAPRT